MNSQELMSVYNRVASITNEMVLAAQTNDWALLEQLEARCSMQVQVIKDNDVPVLQDGEREAKIRVLQQILADDRKIRDLTDPKLAQLGALLQRSSTQEKLARAYVMDHRYP